MPDDLDRALERQARWQRARAAMSWSEKIREVERLLPTLERFRALRDAPLKPAARSSGPRS